jgi:hypothetical protein
LPVIRVGEVPGSNPGAPMLQGRAPLPLANKLDVRSFGLRVRLDAERLRPRQWRSAPGSLAA